MPDTRHQALDVLTSTGTNSWLAMIKQGATATMEVFTKSLDGRTFLRHRDSLEQPLPPSAVTLPEAG